MKLLFQIADKLDKDIRNAIDEVVDNCKICRKFKKTPPRPSVAMPKALSVNEVVSLDLKEKRNLGKYILYACDEFCGYLAAQVLKDKKT